MKNREYEHNKRREEKKKPNEVENQLEINVNVIIHSFILTFNSFTNLILQFDRILSVLCSQMLCFVVIVIAVVCYCGFFIDIQ